MGRTVLADRPLPAADGWYVPPAPSHTAYAPAPALQWTAADASRILLIVFSGRCALSSCTPPDENEDALSRTLVRAVVADASEGRRVTPTLSRAQPRRVRPRV